jgi:hypothetical protein
MSTPTENQTLATKVEAENAASAEEEVIYVKAGSSIPVYIDIDYLKTRGLDVSISMEPNLHSKEYRTATNQFLKKSGSYIVPYLGKFYYYKIATPRKTTEQSNFWKTTFPTHIRREGFVIINREAYYVTLDDLKRNVVRESRIIPLKRTLITYEDFVNNTYGPKGRTKDSKQDEASVQVKPRKGSGTQYDNWGFSIDEASGVGKYTEIDLVHQEQERALFNLIPEEEEWEYVASQDEKDS